MLGMERSLRFRSAVVAALVGDPLPGCCEVFALLRSLLIIAVVALLAAVISHLERAQAQRQVSAAPISWIRTVDGWEPSSVLSAESASSPPSLHPSLVASFQLGVSLFALVAFPTRRGSARQQPFQKENVAA